MPDAIAADLPGRLAAAGAALAATGGDALLLTPGAALRYLSGYEADPRSERITCLVLIPGRDPALLVPRLELARAATSPAGGLGLELVSWSETEDAGARLAGLLPAGARRVAVDDQMWAARVLDLAERLPRAELVAAGPLIAELRARKSPAELAALAGAAEAIDAVHARVAELLRAGRTELEVARDLSAAIVAAGHERSEFVIVGSGPNGASPHAAPTDRVIGRGEPVVVDIGGAMPDGYCSDSTRTYVLGPPPAELAERYAVLLEAQRAQCVAARPGITAAELDAIGREVLTAAGLGPAFIHRTGHGIGLEVHEEPYIVAGSARVLEPGMTFSIEPGFYVEGRCGARIEDIVVCDPAGDRRLNRRPRELAVLDG